MELLVEGKLNEHLHGIDEECRERMECLIMKMKEREGVTERLKTENQMEWLGRMNNILNLVEEIFLKELVYQ